MTRQTFLSSRFQYTFGPHEPMLRVQRGSSLSIVCPDSDNAMADNALLKPEQKQQVKGTVLFEGNPVAGPVHVEDARPGDVIAVKIEAIELDRVKGQTLLAPGHGLLPDHLLRAADGEDHTVPRHLYEWSIDTGSGTATLVNALGADPIVVQLDPFVGTIGICPEWGQHISTLLSGNFGGNMDIPITKPGATLYLPVYAEGGLLSLGDIHAAQGHGEIIGGAIETSGKIDCTIGLIKSGGWQAPRLRNADHLWAMGSDGELRQAIVNAYVNLLDWLSEDLHMNRWDAYNLISQTGIQLLGNFGFSPYTVAAGIPLAALPETRQEEVASWPL